MKSLLYICVVLLARCLAEDYDYAKIGGVDGSDELIFDQISPRELTDMDYFDTDNQVVNSEKISSQENGSEGNSSEENSLEQISSEEQSSEKMRSEEDSSEEMSSEEESSEELSSEEYILNEINSENDDLQEEIQVELEQDVLIQVSEGELFDDVASKDYPLKQFLADDYMYQDNNVEVDPELKDYMDLVAEAENLLVDANDVLNEAGQNVDNYPAIQVQQKQDDLTLQFQSISGSDEAADEEEDFVYLESLGSNLRLMEIALSLGIFIGCVCLMVGMFMLLLNVWRVYKLRQSSNQSQNRKVVKLSGIVKSYAKLPLDIRSMKSSNIAYQDLYETV